MLLVGHSFGGFVASKYTLRHPEYVQKLCLLSPFGAEIPPEGYFEKFDEQMRNGKFLARNVWKFMRYVYTKNISVFGFARGSGRLLGGYGIKRAIKRRLGTENDELVKYMHQIVMARCSSEVAFNIMFPKFWDTENPIMKYLESYKEKNIPVSFIYGDTDWVN